MPRTPSLTIDCSSWSDKITDIIEIFNQIGWCFSSDKMEYIALHSDCDWIIEDLNIDKLFSVISEQQAADEHIGVVLEYGETGVLFTAHSTNEIVLLLSIGRRTIENIKSSFRRDYTDVSWYMENIVYKLEEAGYMIENIEFEEYIC